MAKTNPAQFIQEVRQEASKVTWPSRKETGVSTAMVFVMVIIAAIFFASARLRLSSMLFRNAATVVAGFLVFVWATLSTS